MTVEITAVGGWKEVGRNMTAVKIDDEAVIFDMGLHLPNYIKLTEEEMGEFVKQTETNLKKADAIPQDATIKDWREKVIAIVVTHAHLDHLGAVPYMAAKYDAPIYCTPFSAEILRTICKDERLDLQNKIIELKPGQATQISKSLKLEFCHITHSTPQTIIATLHTPDGIVMYGNDYKLDSHPTLGTPVNYEHLKNLGEKGVLALIQDCLYSKEQRKTPSEQVAKDMLRDVLIDIDNKGKGIIITTFASHIARLKTITEFGKLLNRKVIIMGRSMAKYCFAAKDIGLVDLSKQAEILKYARQIKRRLKEIQNKKDKYLIVVSGHQGEPKSTLNKMIDGIYNWKFTNDHVIFSSQIIPAEINIQQRQIMDEKLRKLGVRIFKDIHVSGHSSREDIREIITLLKPKHLLPTHGEEEKLEAFSSLAKEMGYDKTLHILENGQRIKL